MPSVVEAQRHAELRATQELSPRPPPSRFAREGVPVRELSSVIGHLSFVISH